MLKRLKEGLDGRDFSTIAFSYGEKVPDRGAEGFHAPPHLADLTIFPNSRKNLTASTSSDLKRTPRTEEELTYDKQRTELLQGLGWRVILFTNDEVFTDVDGVVEAIWEALKEAR